MQNQLKDKVNDVKKTIRLLLVIALCAALTSCAVLPSLPTGSTPASSQEAEPQTDTVAAASTEMQSTPATEASPEAAPGYVFYENELFTTEIPADWELQKTKILYFYDTVLEPHEGKSIWSSIVVNGGGYKDGDIDALYKDYTDTGFAFKFYEITVCGQPAAVFERGGGELGLSMRDIYTATPKGTRFILHFNCPDNGEAFSFEAIGEVMDHFLSCLRFKETEGESAPSTPVTEPAAPTTTTAEPILFFDAVEIEDFAGFEGMTRADLKARYGEPNSDDGSVMTYDSVSWNGWIGNMRFFFDSSAESCKTNCASWTTSGDEGIFHELCDALNSRGWLGETSYPKEGQVEKAYIIDNFEVIAGNEDSASGAWTYMFARLHT